MDETRQGSIRSTSAVNPISPADTSAPTLHPAEFLSNKFIEAFERRQRKAAEYNASLDDATNPVRPPRRKRIAWTIRSLRTNSLPAHVADFVPAENTGSTLTRKQRVQAMEREWRARSGRRKASVAWTLNEIMEGFWIGGLFKVVGDTSTLMAPLLTKELIKFSQAGE
jgi:hypothetical protein